MPKTPTARKRWVAEHTTRVTLKLNNNTDADILAMLAAAESKAGLIKKALRAYREEQPHGRLIDADALRMAGYALAIRRIDLDSGGGAPRTWTELVPLDDEDVAPTIVPREKEEG